MKDLPIETLIGRKPASFDVEAARAIVGGKRVLVTGAGGSVGGELARRIAEAGPARLTLLDASEFSLFDIDFEIGQAYPRLSRRAILCDVRHATRLNERVIEENPDIVFHAAALKHVSLVEAHPREGVAVNVIGARNAARAARLADASVFVLISTDKAIDPLNVMGASKRLAELAVTGVDAEPGGARTRTLIVRFGNVFGSTGSVVPIFARQIERGGPLTLTDPEATRFFMTLEEAAHLLFQAAGLALSEPKNGVKTYALTMGEPVRIGDLAERMIRALGAEGVETRAIGLRPGEKTSERLFSERETAEATPAPGVIRILPLSADIKLTSAQCDQLARVADGSDSGAMLTALSDILARLDSHDDFLIPDDAGD